MGRSILVIVWHLLNDPAARYRDLGSGWHARHTDRSRKARNARRQLEALGCDVIITLRKTPPDHPAPLTAYSRRQAPGPRLATGLFRRLPEQWSR